ncbi:class I SAM-dependent methyltransferase [Aurantiacibacter sediminis]|uniref:Class I SAM-dependent methyltransferase n=1 Tax=Aurantiacibacter sediminis TaxID=2793064 RepID=A0ABS0N4S4_9SPHN|nr:class I SAM-dependent methyltransferase [Aurantiacibacter sediminis]MBH5322439.1 hypothetical protein [Aurantiacibacter sediminis]
MKYENTLWSKVKRQMGSFSRLGTDRKLRQMSIEDRIKFVGHRYVVGAVNTSAWFEIGKLQFDFLLSNGLTPDKRFLDVACGALRLGQFMIPYLDKGHYHGLEGEKALVDGGLREEVPHPLIDLKAPQFYFNYEFDVPAEERFDFMIAQSLFTHLVPDDIRKCFAKLRRNASDDCKFFFTYGRGDSNGNPNQPSDPNVDWRYAFDEMASFAADGGWKARDIGHWYHPRGQQIAVAEPV